jgi:prepilin-type N-terminal cleavage/methylation domain-containing protein
MMQRLRGFTLVEVLVAMLLISVMAFATLYTLKITSRTSHDSAPTAKVSMSYRNIKAELVKLIESSAGPRIRYSCVKSGSAQASLDVAFEGFLCEQEVFLDPSGSFKVEVLAELQAGSCIYRLSAIFTDSQRKRSILRVWQDEKRSC